MAFKKKEDCKKPPAWLTSFSDLMSLLLTFFILIYAMSSLDVAQLAKFLSYFQPDQKFHVIKNSILQPIAPPPKEVAFKIKRRIKKTLPPWAFQIVVTADFVKLRLFDKIFFENGTYRLTPRAKKTLDELAEVLKGLGDAYIRVEGHVSPVTEVRDPLVGDRWGLSIRRATEVVRYLQSKGIDPARMSAGGYGDKRPLYTWRQPILIERNNRVEVYITIAKPRE